MMYICIKFQESTTVSQNSFRVTERTHILHKSNVQRVITPKVGSAELVSLCSTSCLVMLYISVKFYQNIWNGFQLTELRRVHGRNYHFQQLLCSKSCNSKRRLVRATVLVLCTSSHSALHFWEISWKYLKTVFNLQRGQKYMEEMAMLMLKGQWLQK